MPPVPSKRSPDLTRQNLLTAAFNEIHRNGFRAASLDAILASAGVTKGALYHHFGSKHELGYAVVEEIIRPFVEENWKPAAEAPDMIDAAIELCRRLTRERSEMGLAYGCPFNNLINEMSPVDEGFRERLSAILRDWRAGVSLAIAEGQRRGTIRKDVDPAAASAFIISCIEGCVGMGKAQQSREFLEAGFRGLIDYLEHLRPEPHEH
jgi:TetR/AcrR family transcriptional regulator, transcriptional repressor for nem operon